MQVCSIQYSLVFCIHLHVELLFSRSCTVTLNTFTFYWFILPFDSILLFFSLLRIFWTAEFVSFWLETINFLRKRNGCLLICVTHTLRTRTSQKKIELKRCWFYGRRWCWTRWHFRLSTCALVWTTWQTNKRKEKSVHQLKFNNTHMSFSVNSQTKFIHPNRVCSQIIFLTSTVFFSPS